MPWKLPAPEDGTDVHAGPNGAAIVDGLGAAEAAADDGAAAAGDVEDPDAELLDPLEPHAATPNATLAPTAAMAATLYFTGTPLWLSARWLSVSSRTVIRRTTGFGLVLERRFGGLRSR
jgi:hypothetical protein